MSRILSMTFLGTCSGGGPILSRACSAISLNVRNELYRDQHWFVDCAEGTLLQIRRANTPRIYFKDIRKIFVTHMHADHIMGIIPLMSNVMAGIRKSDEHLQETVRMELYGPQGLRRFIRENLYATRANLLGRYAVHELIGTFDSESPFRDDGQLRHHPNESAGRNLEASEDGLWRDIVVNEGTSEDEMDVRVDAGPIKHRSYVFTERKDDSTEPRRKAVILGDTSDPSALTKVAMDASVLVHEATNAWMPPGLEHPPLDPVNAARARAKNHTMNKLFDTIFPNSTASTSDPRDPDSTPFPPSDNILNFSCPISDDFAYGATGNPQPVQDSPASVREYAIQNGHSTPDMAGEFAKSIRARRLFMTHFSTRFPDAGSEPRSRNPNDKSVPKTIKFEYRQSIYNHRKNVMAEIERQATEAWGLSGASAIAARDLLNVRMPAVAPEDGD